MVIIIVLLTSVISGKLELDTKCLMYLNPSGSTN